jgi:hypothetical protein
LDSRFAVSKLAEDDGFLREKQIHVTTSFAREVKPIIPYKI